MMEQTLVPFGFPSQECGTRQQVPVPIIQICELTHPDGHREVSLQITSVHMYGSFFLKKIEEPFSKQAFLVLSTF